MTDNFRTFPDWEDLRFFLALAEHGSLSATARALGVNHATVARRVASLENTLNRVLFDRRSDGYVLTLAGQAVREQVAAMETSVLGLQRHLDQADGGGVVRLTTTRVLADAFLAAALGRFLHSHPQIEVELLCESRLLSLARREADVALRFGAPRSSELKGRRLADISYGIYGLPDWREAVAAGQPPAWVGFDPDSRMVPEALWLARTFPKARLVFRSNSWTAQAAAVRAGAGIGLLPRYLAEGLVPVDVGAMPSRRALWMLVRPDLAQVPRVRRLTDFLATLFDDPRF